MGQGSTSDPVAYLSASSVAAVLNFPLWKAATIGQSGFAHAGDSLRGKIRILFGPPYKGVAATMFGMTWARAAIFYCSDTGKRMLQQHGSSTAVATSLPAVLISTLVQVINHGDDIFPIRNYKATDGSIVINPAYNGGEETVEFDLTVRESVDSILVGLPIAFTGTFTGIIE